MHPSLYKAFDSEPLGIRFRPPSEKAKRMGFFLVLKRSCSRVRPFTLINPNGESSLLALFATTFSGSRARTLISSYPFFVSSFVALRGHNLYFASLPKLRLFSSQTSALSEATTSDGLTVDAIVSKRWPILDESEGDWRSHAAAIAQSIQLIKKRLQVDLFSFYSSLPRCSFFYAY